MIKDGLINEILDISMIIFYSLFVNVLYFHPIFYIIYLNICFNQVNSTQDEPSALITIISIKNIQKKEFAPGILKHFERRQNSDLDGRRKRERERE